MAGVAIYIVATILSVATMTDDTTVVSITIWELVGWSCISTSVIPATAGVLTSVAAANSSIAARVTATSIAPATSTVADTAGVTTSVVATNLGVAAMACVATDDGK